MYSLPIVRAIHFWHFFTEAVGILLSCLVHSCLVQLRKNRSFVKEGIWRCFEVKNINYVWHFLLHFVAVYRWVAGQPKLLHCCSAGRLHVQLLLWLFHCFPQWEGFIHYLPSGSFRSEGRGDWISTSYSRLSVSLAAVWTEHLWKPRALRQCSKWPR